MKNETSARRVAEKYLHEGRFSGEIALAGWLIEALDELKELRASIDKKASPPESSR